MAGAVAANTSTVNVGTSVLSAVQHRHLTKREQSELTVTDA
jgi:hypothetical protein